MRYHNFDIWIDRKMEGTYPLRAGSETLGEARDFLSLDPDTPDLQEARRRLARQQTTRELLVDFGTRLYGYLFTQGSKGIEALFQRCCGEVLSRQDEGIRLRLRIEAPDLATLPWEFLYSPSSESFLGTSIHTPLVRYLEVFEPILPLPTEPPLRMLIVIPDSPGLNTEDERANLASALTDLEDYVHPTILEGNVTWIRISDALLEERFNILHFIGHGDFREDQAFLQLNSEDRHVEYIGHTKFASLFANHKTMKLVVLNSCKGAEVSSAGPLVGMAPQLVLQGIPAVIAMQYSIYDDVAILFAREFYRSLFKGWASGRVEVAMSHARNRLAGKFPDERAMGTPVLFMRAKEGVLFNLVTGSRVAEIPFSKKQLYRSQAVAQTHEQNIAILDSRQQGCFDPQVQETISTEREELARLKQRLRFRNIALVTAISLALLMVFLGWMRVFDLLGLDTKIETYTVWVGDLFTGKTVSEGIAMIAITEETERALKRPFGSSWRHEHAMLVEGLSQAGAKVIAFDMHFPEPSRYDDEFVAAIRRARERGTAVIVGVAELAGREPVLIGRLREAVTAWGVLCIGRTLGYARTAPLVIVKDGRVIPSLAMATVVPHEEGILEVDRANQEIRALNPATRQLDKIGFAELERVKQPQPFCPAIGEGDMVANLFIDLSPLEVLRYRGWKHAYHESIDPRASTELERFKGKIVLVGVEKKDS